MYSPLLVLEKQNVLFGSHWAVGGADRCGLIVGEMGWKNDLGHFTTSSFLNYDMK